MLSIQPIHGGFFSINASPTRRVTCVGMKTTIHSSRGAPRRPVVGLWLLLVGCLLAGPSLRADTLYVSNYGDNSISQITADGVVTRFATVLPKPFGLAFDS